MRTPRRAALCSLAALGLLLTACTAGGGDSSAAAAPDANTPVTLTVWSPFADRELGVLKSVFDAYHAKHPNVTINSVGSQDDDKITAAIRSGNPPDVAVSFTADNVGQFCTSGAFADLKPYIDRDKVDLTQIPKAVLDYTQYQGQRCAMPMLSDVYGLYYNKDMFAAAGISSPPKTMSQLLDDAKKLTVRNPDGSIKVAGFVPQVGFYENQPTGIAVNFGAQWMDSNGKSDLAKDPQWTAAFNWVKQMTDFYGWNNLNKFTSGLGQEFSADNAFESGKVAMAFDGEYRTAFISGDKSGVHYDTAPFPVADNKPELYGGGFTTGTILGIPRGAKNAGAAWDLIKYLSTDTGAEVALANGLNNVPTINSALTSPDLKLPAQFKTFLTIAANPHLESNPGSPNGGAYIKNATDLFNSWQSGTVSDLPAELSKLDKSIDDAKALGK